MNKLPIELENIIFDYKKQLELSKIKIKCLRELKKTIEYTILDTNKSILKITNKLVKKSIIYSYNYQ